MARAKHAVPSKRKRREVLKQAKGYTGAKSRRFRTSHEQVMHALDDAYAHRRAKKGDFRRLWITRINAAARQHGTTYSQLIAGLKAAEVDIDRKMLADLALNEPDSFKNLVDVAAQARGDG